MTDLVPSMNPAELVAKRDRIAQHLIDARECLRLAQEELQSLNPGVTRLKLPWIMREALGVTGRLLHKNSVKRCQDVMDTQLWDYVLRETGIRTFMDAKARRDWADQISNLDTPELTTENIYSTIEGIRSSKKQMFTEGVVRVFQGLSWDYKSNQPVKFGKRIIMEGALDAGVWLYASHHAGSQMDDLERVLAIMSGNPEPDHRQGWYRRVGEMLKADKMECSSAYMRVKFYKKGTAHIYIAPELLDTLNSLIADEYPNALPHR